MTNSRGRFLLAASLAAVAACGGGDEASEVPATETPGSVAEAPALPEFAESLDVDLSQMRRSGTGLYVLDMEEGTGLAAKEGHVVSVHYTGWLPTGDVFDSNVAGDEPFTFQLGRRDVIAGWEEGVRGMRINGKRRLVIPPELAYGQRGSPGAIPPNAHLVFDVELLDIKM